MAAHLVQHHHNTFGAPLGGERGNPRIQALQHDAVQALARRAQSGVLAVIGVCRGHARADALATGLVVDPEDCQTRAGKHIEHGLVVRRAIVKVLAAQVGKHAGHRRRGAGAARPGIAKADHLFAGQSWGGVARIAIDAEVHAAGSFAQYQDEQRRLALTCVGGAQLGILSRRRERSRV